MTHFLVVFDRKAGLVKHMKSYSDGKAALRARFEYERTNKLGSDTEVVVLVSESEAALQRTHGRYFSQMKDLVETALSRPETKRPKSAQSPWKAKVSRLVGRTA